MFNGGLFFDMIMRMNARGLVKQKKKLDKRTMAVRGFFIAFALVIAFRLFTIQVVNASFYEQLASGQHDFYKELFAERGKVYVKDWRDGVEFVAVTNQPVAFVYAEPRKINDPVYVTNVLAEIFGYQIPVQAEEESEEVQISQGIMAGVLEESVDEQEGVEGEVAEVVEQPKVSFTKEYDQLLQRLSKENDPYEPVRRGVDERTLERIKAEDLEGIRYVLENGRTYPETGLGGHIFGFLGVDSEGSRVGSYGLEGYFNGFLSGENGFLNTQADSTGRWIGVAARTFEPAQQGGDILLTIDRTIQFKACEALQRGVRRYNASGGSVVILEPKTGKVMAMCNVPDFDPNQYSKVANISYYNNRAIFEAYEPGSVFKSIVMAAALDRGAVTPTSIFEDKGEEKIDRFTIRNSDLKAHGWVDMTYVLENSLNTGMIHAMRQMGGAVMAEYIDKFGFGAVSGIELNTEVAGNTSSLERGGDVYYATASFGQGLTVTPFQIASAYATIANNGTRMKPYIVEELRYADGAIEKTKPQELGQVISAKTASTIGAMMVSVVEKGHAGAAAVPGYYIAGKTGTAQVARTDGAGYQSGVTKATFAGYGPVEDPAFVMVVMLDHPKTSPWASDTSAPIFGEIAQFVLQYLDIPPRR